MGGAHAPRDRRADRAAKRFGAKGLVHLAVEPSGAVRGPIAKFLADGRAARDPRARRGASEGDLILVVADAPAVTADVLGRLRVELGERLGLADPRRAGVLSGSTASRCTSGTPRAAAGTRPTTRSAAWSRRTRSCSSRRPATRLEAVAGRSGRPGPRDAVRRRAQRLGAGRRLDPDPPARPARAELRGCRATRWSRCARSSGRCSTRSSTARRRTAGSRSGIDRWAALLTDQTNIREVMAFPKTQSGTDLMLEAPSPPEPGAARRARA